MAYGYPGNIGTAWGVPLIPSFPATSEYKGDLPIPVAYGVARVKPVVLWRGPVTDRTVWLLQDGAWKAGRGPGAQTVLGICETPITSVDGYYLDGNYYTDFSKLVDRYSTSYEIVTSSSPSAWSAFTGNMAGVAYRGTAQFRAVSFSLPNGNLPNIEFKIKGGAGLLSNGSVDTLDANGFADPASVILHLLTTVRWGCGQDTSNALGFALADVDVDYGPDNTTASGYRTYCKAHGFRICGSVNSPDDAARILEQILYCTNSTAVWTGGKLKIIPLGDTALTANGATYTPPSTSVVINTDELVKTGDGDPISVARVPEEDIYNLHPVTVEVLNNAFEPFVYGDPIPEHAAIYGVRRKEPTRLDWVKDLDHAAKLSQILARRNVYCRSTYRFKLSPRWAALEPMDPIALTEPAFGLSSTRALITRIEESPDGTLDVEALEWPLGTAKPVDVTPDVPDGSNRPPPSPPGWPGTNDPGDNIGGINLLLNSGFESINTYSGTWTYGSGTAPERWALYNNGTESATISVQSSGGINGGAFARVTWASNNTTTKGILTSTAVGDLTGSPNLGGVRGGWVAGTADYSTIYTVSFYAKASSTNVGQVMYLAWNTAPAGVTWLYNPPLTTSWQRYVARVRWGASVETDGRLFITIAVGSGTSGNLDLDNVQVQFGAYATEYAPAGDEVLPRTINNTHISVGGVTTENLAIGNGINLITNASWGIPGAIVGNTSYTTDSARIPGWYVSYNAGTNWSWTGYGLNLSSWNLAKTTDVEAGAARHGNTLFCGALTTTGPTGGECYAYTTPAIEVKEGSTYCASVYAAAHRCTAEIILIWLNSSGTWFSSTTQTATRYVVSDNGGGSWLSGYTRLYTMGVAPAGAVQAIIYLKAYNPTTSSSTFYTFWTRAQFEETNTGATGPSPWVPGVSTVIDGSGIKTGTLSGSKLIGNSLETSDYAYTGTKGTANEVATTGARLRTDSTSSGSLPAIVTSAAGLKVGGTTFDSAWFTKAEAHALSATTTNSGTSWTGYDDRGATVTVALQGSAPNRYLRFTFPTYFWEKIGSGYKVLHAVAQMAAITTGRASSDSRYAVGVLTWSGTYIDVYMWNTTTGAWIDMGSITPTTYTFNVLMITGASSGLAI